MYLERLDIHGFKSFGRKTTIIFETRPHTKPGVTAIVGPNGSGKSCVAESIRWVLGEQSSKQLRGKKMEDIIFAGSEKKARLGLAEVTLTLNNEDHAAPIEVNQLSITRRLYRDGKSEYLLNNALTRLSDIQMLLARAHFGQRSYSVIGQGMIDTILLASPKERKESFDEAAHVKQYQIKRDESIRKLEGARDNVHEVELVLQEITPRLRSLTRQVHRLERREEIERELRALQSRYYGALTGDLTRELKEQKTKRLAEETERKKHEHALNTAQEKLAALEKQEVKSDAFSKLQQEYDALIKKQSALREQEFTLKSTLVRMESVAKTPGAIPPKEVALFLDELAATHDTLIERLIAATTFAEVEELKPAFKNIHARIHAFRDRLQQSPKDTSKEKRAIDKELVGIATARTTLTSDVERIQKELTNLGKADQEKKSAFFTLQRDLQEQQTLLMRAQQRENDVRIVLARLEQREEDLQNEMGREGVRKNELTHDAALRSADVAELLPEIQKKKHDLELIGGIDPETITEYQKTKERHDFLDTQTRDLHETIDQLEGAIQELDETIKEQFDIALQAINLEFQKFFKILFGGGKAALITLKDVPPEELPTDEEAEDVVPKKKRPKKLKHIITGIDIEATPPGKKISSIAMLSGGEKALTSIALIAAFISFNPSPFVVLDEVDAALDEANAERFARILDALSDKTQFIAITHNRATMERAAILYGVTMGGDGVSNILSVKFEDVKK